MLENLAVGLGSRRALLRYVVSVFENTSKNLEVQRRVQLEYSIHIVMVRVDATWSHFNPWCILKETTKLAGPFGTMPQKPWHSRKGAKPNRVIQLNCGKCTPTQVIKQPEHGRTSATEEQWSSFQANYD